MIQQTQCICIEHVVTMANNHVSIFDILALESYHRGEDTEQRE